MRAKGEFLAHKTQESNIMSSKRYYYKEGNPYPLPIRNKPIILGTSTNAMEKAGTTTKTSNTEESSEIDGFALGPRPDLNSNKRKQFPMVTPSQGSSTLSKLFDDDSDDDTIKKPDDSDKKVEGKTCKNEDATQHSPPDIMTLIDAPIFYDAVCNIINSTWNEYKMPRKLAMSTINSELFENKLRCHIKMELVPQLKAFVEQQVEEQIEKRIFKKQKTDKNDH